jgi:hypothetical protein
VQAGSPDHRKLRRLRAGVVSVAEKARCQRVRWVTRRRTCVTRCWRIDRRNDGIKTGGVQSSRDKGPRRLRALSQGVACVLPWRCPV